MGEEKCEKRVKCSAGLYVKPFNGILLYDMPEKELFLRFSEDLHVCGLVNGKLFRVK